MFVALTGHSPQHMPNARRVRSFHGLARAANHYDLDFLLVQPQQLKSTPSVVGWSVAIDGTPDDWFQTASALRNGVVYDAMYLSELRQQKKIYSAAIRMLKQRKFSVFNPVLPAKDRILQLVEQGAIDNPFPRTWYRPAHVNVTSLLETTGAIWLKPPFGSGGRNLILIQRLDGGNFHVISENFRGHSIREQLNAVELQRFIGKLERRRRSYMLQEHVNLLRTKDEKKVDLRITVQRGIEGTWAVTAVTGRLSLPNSWLTNYHAGGTVVSLANFDRKKVWYEQTGMDAQDLERASHLALRLAERLQEDYPLLGMLGIDVGQDVNGSQFIYDCNSRPGRDILTDDEVDRFMLQTAGFARYLLDRKGEERRKMKIDLERQ